MSHGKAVWRRFRFFFTGHQPSCQRGPFLGFVLTPFPVLFFFVLFSCDSAISLPCHIFRDTLSCFVPPGWPFWRDCGSHSFLFCLCIPPASIRVTPRRLSHRVIFGVIRRFDFIHSFSGCSLFERWGQYIDFFAVACTYTLSGATKIQDAQKGLLETLWCVWSASCFQVYSAQFFFGSSGRMQDLTVENLRMCNSWKWHDSYRVFL